MCWHFFNIFKIRVSFCNVTKICPAVKKQWRDRLLKMSKNVYEQLKMDLHYTCFSVSLKSTDITFSIHLAIITWFLKDKEVCELLFKLTISNWTTTGLDKCSATVNAFKDSHISKIVSGAIGYAGTQGHYAEAPASRRARQCAWKGLGTSPPGDTTGADLWWQRSGTCNIIHKMHESFHCSHYSILFINKQCVLNVIWVTWKMEWKLSPKYR